MGEKNFSSLKMEKRRGYEEFPTIHTLLLNRSPGRCQTLFQCYRTDLSSLIHRREKFQQPGIGEKKEI
jgi:hypothetical protein